MRDHNMNHFSRIWSLWESTTLETLAKKWLAFRKCMKDFNQLMKNCISHVNPIKREALDISQRRNRQTKLNAPTEIKNELLLHVVIK